jgi:hypothetical protein
MIKMPSVLTDYFPLKGGLNLVTPPLSMPDGACRDALNFEVDIDGGYRRIAGYERYSGQIAPSTAVYYLVPNTAPNNFSVGDVITGETSAATGVVIAIGSASIFITKMTGTFLASENIQVGGITEAITNSDTTLGGASSPKLDAIYTKLASDVYRNDIGVVPGVGNVLGVWRYKGNVYAFRNNVGLTAALMYKESPSGWELVQFDHEIYFTNADLPLLDAGTLTQGANTAEIKRVVVQSGSLQSGVNKGKLIIRDIVGTFANGAATTSEGATLTIEGAELQITLPINGRYEFVNNNFGGAINTQRMYGVNGVGRAFEFDGDVLVPLDTGNTTDTPSVIAVNNNYLFLSFTGSLQYSSIGDPYMWSPITGAGEIAMGDTITGMLPLVGAQATQALAVFTVNRTSVLYGSSPADFQLISLSFEAGGMPRTMQNLGDGYVFDVLGVRQLSATDRFGNFAQAQITRYIRPFVTQRATKSVGSCVVRSRDQYRLLFNDNFALYFTMENGKLLGVMPIRYADTMSCMVSFEADDGEEFIYCGGTNGYVYRMDKGTSFDGKPIDALLSLTFSYAKGPRTRKRYRKAVYEFTGQGYADIEASYELGYGTFDIANGLVSLINSPNSPVFWDSFTWDSFFWDGKSLLPVQQELTGTAENISLVLRCLSADYKPFTINSAIIHYTPRRQER